MQGKAEAEREERGTRARYRVCWWDGKRTLWQAGLAITEAQIDTAGAHQ
jgi:hypothetical protein